LKLDYRAMGKLVETPGDLTLAVALRKVDDAGRYGRVVVSGDRIEAFAAQGTPGPGWINAGVYLMDRTIFERYPVPAAFSFEADFLQKRVAAIHPRAFPCHAPFIDIGVPESFEQSQVLLPAWTKP
jgi:D-glycero-alpha-D-manno-heptose 1-phosphate guanylyltransferase